MLRLENMIFKVVANRKHSISKTLKQASINYNEKNRERKGMNKKNLRSTSKQQLRYHQHHQKKFNKRNLTISIKVFNGAQSGSHSPSKDK